MATIPEGLSQVQAALPEIGARRTELASNLNTMGVSAADTETLETLVPKVLDIRGGTTTETPGVWTRPADRPEKPTMADNTILMLFGVGENSPNDIAFLVYATGGYTVDWGDGTSNSYSSGAQGEHLYNYSGITAEVDSLGYKMVWMTITPTTTGNNITALNLLRKHSSRPTSTSAVAVPQVFEMYIQCPGLASLIFVTSTVLSGCYVRYQLLEIFSLDVNSITGAINYLLAYCYNLRTIEKLEIGNSSGITYFMYTCRSFNGLFPDSVTFENVSTYFMTNCTAYNQPFPDGATFKNASTNFMTYCQAYNQPFPDSVTFENVSTYFMQGCQAYNQPFPDSVTFKNASTNFMNNCQAYNQPFPDGVTFKNVTVSFMQYCTAYNQPFPDGVTFANATTYFMNNCTAYNQPFPDGVTFENATTYFMSACNSYNQPFPDGVTFKNVIVSFMNSCGSYNHTITVDLAKTTTAIGTGFIGTACYALKGLRLLNMGTVHTALTTTYTAMDHDALLLLGGDLADRTATTSGTWTCTGSYGASELTDEETANIYSTLNWTVVT